MNINPLTLCHLSVLGALNPLAVVEPDDGGVRQTSHFTFEHGLLSLDHIQVVKWFDEVGHGETFHLILWDLRLFWDRWHLLQFSPEGKKRNVSSCIKMKFFQPISSNNERLTPSYICEEIAGRGSCM